MRISDWSSDVCSSDLCRGREVEEGIQIDRIVGHMRGGEFSAAPCEGSGQIDGQYMQAHTVWELFNRETQISQRTQSSGDRRDRKSVVTGKSVSVRVDLGGSRIIQKKI